MQVFQNLLSKIKPHFEEGGKLEKFYYGYDAIETFLFVPGHSTHKGEAHIKDGIDLKRTMFTVVIAMIPCLLFGMWNVGHQYYLAAGEFTALGDGFVEKMIHGAIKVLPIVIVSYGVGLNIEFAFAIFRKHPVNEGFLVTGMLIPLVMPPTVPLWMVGLATAFAVLIGKEAFGGTGMNILNVALTARVFIFFAYPTYISGDTVWIADGVTGATPLGVGYLDGLAGLQANPNYTIENMVLGFIPGSIGETSLIAIGLGALILIATGIGSWKIMLSVLAGAFATATTLFLFDITPFAGVPPYYHIFMGSMLFAAVFMATDPVTATQTEMGKWIYGFLIGVFGIIIRVLNPAYPEGWMLAILLMNVFAPTIDHMIIQSNIKRRMSRALK
ncbi:MAG: NADH:ubiquinone reductase (Na(+)-transporting) subunit B [Rhodothermaceae bacterium]|nr:NADH:ubiquinone reductase (Na(+)-transporting) subunit B [Rhodothermaceae bacterium]